VVLIRYLIASSRVKQIICTASLLCLLIPPPTWATSWRSDIQASQLNFAPSYEGLPINGDFKEFAVIYTTDQEGEPEDLSVSVLVASADLGNSELNTEIRAAKWFNITAFPEAKFSCQEFTTDNNGKVFAHGELQIKGYKKPVTVPFSWRLLTTGEAVMRGELMLARNSFSIGSDEWASGDQIGLAVKVWFDVVLNPINPSL
jgi:polyisoprenoid-binding protein YceI